MWQTYGAPSTKRLHEGRGRISSLGSWSTVSSVPIRIGQAYRRTATHASRVMIVTHPVEWQRRLCTSQRWRYGPCRSLRILGLALGCVSAVKLSRQALGKPDGWSNVGVELRAPEAHERKQRPCGILSAKVRDSRARGQRVLPKFQWCRQRRH